MKRGVAALLDILFVVHALACAPVQPLGIRFFSIPSGSMEPSVHVGSTVAAYRCAYGLSRWSYESFQLPLSGRWPPGLPTRGDIVVFRLPANPSTFRNKRVIGLPGDRIELRQGRRYINGWRAPLEGGAPGRLRRGDDEPFEAQAFRETLPRGVTYSILPARESDGALLRDRPPVLVPEWQLYVLGDNRGNSVDSRMGAATGWGGSGTVPVEYVFGSVVGIGGPWPFDLLRGALERLGRPHGQ